MRRSMTGAPKGVAIAICALALGAATGGWARAVGTTGSPTARAAERMSLVETAHLKLAYENGSTLTERGQATGTYDAPMTATLTIRPKSVTSVVTIYPRGGTIKGTAHANYVVQGSYGFFGGTLTLDRGTGAYRHVSEVNGKPLGFSGKIQRFRFTMEVKAHGEVNL
jgi:hypothetical protein